MHISVPENQLLARLLNVWYFDSFIIILAYTIIWRIILFDIFYNLLLQESDGELEEGEHEASDESSDGELHDVCGFTVMFL